MGYRKMKSILSLEERFCFDLSGPVSTTSGHLGDSNPATSKIRSCWEWCWRSTWTFRGCIIYAFWTGAARDLRYLHHSGVKKRGALRPRVTRLLRIQAGTRPKLG